MLSSAEGLWDSWCGSVRVTDLPTIALPRESNYIGSFLTFGCNLNCAYCINDPLQDGGRRDRFGTRRREMTPGQWCDGLSRIPSMDNLPITLQGGEPTLFGGGKGLGAILRGTDHKFDLLTNLALPPEKMAVAIDGQVERLRRAAPYPSIRVSYHRAEMNRVWGNGAQALVDRCEALRVLGFVVSDDKPETDVGIYVVVHPDNDDVERLREASAGRVYVEPKEFLGVHAGRLYGTYKYPFSTNLLASAVWPETLECQCRTTELLIDPLGFIWRCHAFLYGAWTTSDLLPLFEALESREFKFDGLETSALPFSPLGHILDPDFRFDVLRQFRPCRHYGICIGCDTKVKNDRFQSLYDQGVAHTSVEIQGVGMPPDVMARIDPSERAALLQAGILMEAKP